MKNGKRLGKKIASGIVKFGKGAREAYEEAYGVKTKQKRKVVKKATTKKKVVAPSYKTIAGKKYKRFATPYSNKGDAAFMALDLRGETNTSARVVKLGNQYHVYYRRKK